MSKVGKLLVERLPYTYGSDEDAVNQAHCLLQFSMALSIDHSWHNRSLDKEQQSINAYHYDTLFKLFDLQLSLIHDKLNTKSPAIHTWAGCLIRAFSWLATVVTQARCWCSIL
jgi:hypothetical protein